MAGREIVYATSNEANGFAALPDENVKADIIYLCSPNNPTGSAYNAEQLKIWVDYALKKRLHNNLYGYTDRSSYFVLSAIPFAYCTGLIILDSKLFSQACRKARVQAL